MGEQVGKRERAQLPTIINFQYTVFLGYGPLFTKMEPAEGLGGLQSALGVQEGQKREKPACFCGKWARFWPPNPPRHRIFALPSLLADRKVGSSAHCVTG